MRSVFQWKKPSLRFTSEVLISLALTYLLTAFSFHSSAAKIWQDYIALGLCGIEAMTFPAVILVLVLLGTLLRRRTGASARFERRLSRLALTVLATGLGALWLGTDFFQNVALMVTSSTSLIGYFATAVRVMSLINLAMGFTAVLSGLHFSGVLSWFHDWRGRVVRLDLKHLTELARIERRGPQMTTVELVTPYPESSHIEGLDGGRALSGPLGGIRGPASFELIGSKNGVVLLSASKWQNDIVNALKRIYHSLRIHRISEPLPLGLLAPRQYLAAAFGIYSDNEFCSLQEFDKSNDLLSHLASCLADFEEGCLGHVQFLVRRRSYDSIASRLIENLQQGMTTDPQTVWSYGATRRSSIVNEIARKTTSPTFAVAINILAWGPTRQAAEATVEAICQTITLQGKFGFIKTKHVNAFDMCHHLQAHEPYRELPMTNRELANIIHMPVHPCRGMRIVRSGPKPAGSLPPEDEDGINSGWELP
jgi:hypothetical protein